MYLQNTQPATPKTTRKLKKESALTHSEARITLIFKPNHYDNTTKTNYKPIPYSILTEQTLTSLPNVSCSLSLTAKLHIFKYFSQKLR